MENLNKRTISLAIIAILLIAIFVPTIVNAESTKDVWIDNTVDNSISHVTGYLKIRDAATGEDTTTLVFAKRVSVTFSNPKSSEVLSAIEDAKSALIEKAKEYVEKFDSETIVENETTGKVWDNRKYETIEDGDAVLIGDTNYIPVDNTVDSDITRTHIASGDYGKETYYNVEAYVEINGEESSIVTYEVTKGANQTYTINKDDSATFTVNADYSLFENGGKVFVDNKEVSTDDYTSKAGSTVITLSKGYMDSLSVGEHTFKVAFNNGGTAETDFTVAKLNNPATGDNISMMIILFVVATLGMIVTIKK